MKSFIRLSLTALLFVVNNTFCQCIPTPSISFSLLFSLDVVECVHLCENSTTQILIRDIRWPYCQADSFYNYYAMQFPWTLIQSGCEDLVTSCNEACSPASESSCFIDNLEWTYDLQTNSLSNVLHGLENGCVCMVIGVPLTPPQYVHFDPANGIGQSFTCESNCYFQLCVGPGLSREQTPILHISSNGDSLGGYHRESGPFYISPLGVFLYDFYCGGPITVTLDAIEPVELVNFTAIPACGEIALNWRTACERDNAAFEIMRDARLVHVETATNSPVGSNYSWTDRRVTNGTTYSYTLVAVALNGSREELRTVKATPTDISSTVTEYALHQNYPNPFNPSTEIVYDMKDAGFVSVKVYNLLGQQVTSLVNGNAERGRHIVHFDATGLPSGVYVLKMVADDFTATNKMLLMK
jgi:hypothetical protein